MGQFQNLEVTDEVTDIPEHLALDAQYIDTLVQSMLLGIELTVNEYYVTRGSIRDLEPEEIVHELAQRKLELTNQLTATTTPQEGE